MPISSNGGVLWRCGCMSWVKLVKVCYYYVGGACCWGRHLNPDRKGKQNGCIMATEITLEGGDLARGWHANTTQGRHDRVGKEPVVWIHKPCFGFWKVEPRVSIWTVREASLNRILGRKKKGENSTSSRVWTRTCFDCVSPYAVSSYQTSDMKILLPQYIYLTRA